jgi:hypothetical protein
MLHHKSPDRDDAKLTNFRVTPEKKFLLDHDQMITMEFNFTAVMLPLLLLHETSFN